MHVANEESYIVLATFVQFSGDYFDMERRGVSKKRYEKKREI